MLPFAWTVQLPRYAALFLFGICRQQFRQDSELEVDRLDGPGRRYVWYEHAATADLSMSPKTSSFKTDLV